MLCRSLMTTFDVDQMAKQGKAATALARSAVASFVGATLATIGLTLFAPFLAQFAIHFGPAEYTALFVLAFTMLSGLAPGNAVKTLIAALLGLMLATISSEERRVGKACVSTCRSRCSSYPLTKEHNISLKYLHTIKIIRYND